MVDTLAIVQTGPGSHKEAGSWYAANPAEPIGEGQSITVGGTVSIPGMTLDSVMDTIIAKQPKNVVIVCHGNPNGLAMPLLAGSPLGVEVEHVISLSADRPFEYAGVKTPVVPDEKVAAGLSPESAKSLRSKMNKIRALGLQHVAFRACDLGSNPEGSLMPFREFFNVASVSAPKFGDIYGKVTAEIGGGLTAWLKALSKKPYTQGWLDAPDVAMTIKRQDATNFKMWLKARTESALLKWYKLRVAPSGGTGRTVVFHAMEDKSAKKGSPAMYFILEDFFKSNIALYPKP